MLRFWLAAVLLWLGSGPHLLAANRAETQAFNAAAHSFRATIWDRAEAEFAEFTLKFPESPRVPEAILLEAQARLQQTNYSGALELLQENLEKSENWRDQYLFWLGEAFFRQADYKSASEYFTRVLREFPASPRRLEAGLGQASALAQLKEWEGLIKLLQEPGGWFETASRGNLTNQLILRGFLLLGEAQMALNRPAAAAAALQPLTGVPMPARNAWQRDYLLTRTRLARNQTVEALQGLTNLYTLAAETGQRHLATESYALGAALWEKAGKPAEAIQAYTNNLAPGVAPERQEEALLQITALSQTIGAPQSAMTILETFLAQVPDSPAVPFALLNLGQLRLRQHLAAAPSATAPGGTNSLTLAIQALGEITNRFPQHAVAGRAYLDLGWCFWRAGQMPESEVCFQQASERLAAPIEKATALLKLGDSQFQQNQSSNALASYSLLARQYGQLPGVKTNFLERALYQAVRAALLVPDLPAAESAMDQILKEFPNGLYADDSVLLTGQQQSKEGNPAAARAIFEAFLKQVPAARLAPEVHLALARTYQQQELWTNAVAEYDHWLLVNTNHPGRVAAEYYRAWSEFQAGQITNAITSFTNLVAHHNDALFTPLAQLWVADYYFGRGDAVEAERNYKALFQNTNLPPSELVYQARLMAGRAALARQGWLDGINHFTNLTSDLNCPVDLRIQAMFAYGDTLMKMDSPETNKLANLGTAVEVFSRICEAYPTNQYAALAWGQKANCLLQWAQTSKDYEPATNAFHQVIQSPLANGTARSIATVGLGLVMEKQAEVATNGQKSQLLIAARDHYLDVFYGKILREDETADAFWRRKAGWDAGRMAETLQQWSQALNIYEQLQKAFPALGPRLERNIRKIQEQLNRERK